MSLPEVLVKDTAAGKQENQGRATRTKSPEALALKQANGAAELLAVIQRDNQQHAEDDARLLDLIRLVFGDKVEKTMKHHPSLTPGDLIFLREKKGFRV